METQLSRRHHGEHFHCESSSKLRGLLLILFAWTPSIRQPVSMNHTTWRSHLLARETLNKATLRSMVQLC